MNAVKAHITKIQRDIDGANKGMTEAGIFTQSGLKLVADWEKELVRLDSQLNELKNDNSNTGKMANLSFDQGTIDAIRKDTLSILDRESPETLRLFLRNYIERITIKVNEVSIKFAFRETSNSCQVLVPGVGLEPT